MENKKGISDVVTTVLIILLVVAAVAIIWGFIQRPLQQGGQALQAGADCLQTSVIPLTCSNFRESASQINANATYKLVSGDAPASVKVIYQLKDGQTAIVSGTAPVGVGNTAKANYSSNAANNATSVSVAIVLKGSDGKDITCAESLEKVACA
jgi:hypothetical protein